MLPVLRQRLLIIAAALVGGLVWMWTAPWLLPVSGYPGIALYDAGIGMAAAIGLVLAAGLPAVGLGVLSSATGHPLSGVFVVATSLSLLAGAGGPVDGFLRRAELPGAYGHLIAETLVWTAGLLGLLALIHVLRPALNRQLAPLATEDHYGRQTRLLALPGGKDLLAGLITTAGGIFFTSVLVRSPAVGQVLGALTLGFTVAATIGHLLSPTDRPLAILLAPVATALVGYGWVLGHFSSGPAVLDAWYEGDLTGLALVLPIHYIAAGVVGCTLGIGLAQSIEHSRAEEAEVVGKNDE